MGNTLLSQNKFWELAKSDDKADLRKLEKLIFLTCEIVRIASVLLLPYTPTLSLGMLD